MAALDPAHLLARVQTEAPAEPRGLFRWLHFHYGFRYPGEDRLALKILRDQGVADLTESFSACQDHDPDAAVAAAERHAWGLGYLGGTVLGGTLWPHLSPLARGKFLAGVSEKTPSDEDKAWLLGHAVEAQLDPVSAVQLGCQAVRHRQPELLQVVIAAPLDWNSQVARADWSSLETDPEWADEVKRLGEGACDLVLEAALQMNDVPAATSALDLGGDPDLPIWRLERSFNERHSALSYSLSGSHQEMARLLLKRGANARGTLHGGIDLPLHLALRDPEMVDVLLDKGAIFPTSSSPETAREALAGRFSWTMDEEDAAWIERDIRPLLPLTGFTDKALFHNANAQGGYWESNLKRLLYDDQSEMIRRYEPLGLDVRLTGEELMTAVTWKARKSLAWLLARFGEQTRDEVLARVREHRPEFVASNPRRERLGSQGTQGQQSIS